MLSLGKLSMISHVLCYLVVRWLDCSSYAHHSRSRPRGGTNKGQRWGSSVEEPATAGDIGTRPGELWPLRSQGCHDAAARRKHIKGTCIILYTCTCTCRYCTYNYRCSILLVKGHHERRHVTTFTEYWISSANALLDVCKSWEWGSATVSLTLTFWSLKTDLE